LYVCVGGYITVAVSGAAMKKPDVSLVEDLQAFIDKNRQRIAKIENQ
jgi:hypothetical protein